MNTASEDVNMNRLRGKSSVLSLNSSRELLTHLDLSSQLYINRMKVENEKLFWDKQVKSQNFQLSYQSINKGMFNNQVKANSTNNIFLTCVKNNTNNSTSMT